MTDQKTILDQIEFITEQLKKSPDDPELLNDLGVGYFLIGDFIKSIQTLKKAVAISQDSATYHFNLANSYASIEVFDLAIHHFHEVLDRSPAHIPSLNNLADCYEKTGNNDRAYELFVYIKNVFPDNALAHFNLGNFLLRGNRHEEAARCYKIAIETEPGFIDAYFNLAWILKEIKAYNEALKIAEEGLVLDENHKDLNKLVSTIYNQLRK